MVEWQKLDVNSFLEQITGFLAEHGQLDGLSSSPPKKRLRSVSMTQRMFFLFYNFFLYIYILVFGCNRGEFSFWDPFLLAKTESHLGKPSPSMHDPVARRMYRQSFQHIH